MNDSRRLISCIFDWLIRLTVWLLVTCLDYRTARHTIKPICSSLEA